MERLTLTLLAVLVVSGCVGTADQGPRYVLEGLDLPAGAIEATYEEGQLKMGELPLPAGICGEVRWAVKAGFNCDQGWEHVMDHVSSSMQQQAGYRQYVPNQGVVDQAVSPAQDTGKYEHGFFAWNSADKLTFVTISNREWASNPKYPPSSYGVSYMLAVIEFQPGELMVFKDGEYVPY